MAANFHTPMIRSHGAMPRKVRNLALFEEIRKACSLTPLSSTVDTKSEPSTPQLAFSNPFARLPVEVCNKIFEDLVPTVYNSPEALNLRLVSKFMTAIFDYAIVLDSREYVKNLMNSFRQYQPLLRNPEVDQRQIETFRDTQELHLCYFMLVSEAESPQPIYTLLRSIPPHIRHLTISHPGRMYQNCEGKDICNLLGALFLYWLMMLQDDSICGRERRPLSITFLGCNEDLEISRRQVRMIPPVPEEKDVILDRRQICISNRERATDFVYIMAATRLYKTPRKWIQGLLQYNAEVLRFKATQMARSAWLMDIEV
ncbi:hypothetical protein M011DRAFT_490243 [Sporormia fimetaria CBS 119925]|uniref:Uncharacterized protein n=1 Tax=Sporormia fimetaria CBS 119925 TaxID=1340428 RepID=A0A6A6UXE9_9PLEO|nr:hypothetical protein M011DRAFT_490243 [Sporormia fimetaria CBS 119925]